MTMLRTERKYVEILRILKDHQEPMGAKRLSELMADRGYVLSDRAVQYYLSYLDAMGFTEKVGNQGRILTREGIAESENALVEDRIGFVISKLERLAFRSTFDPQSGTGDVAYNLTTIPEEQLEGVCSAFDEVVQQGLGFFSSYHIVDRDPRIPAGSAGIMTICSITMDGVLQRRGVPVRMAYGGRLAVVGGEPSEFLDLIGYRGTTIDPLQLFISAGLTSISTMKEKSNGTVLANVREVPVAAGPQVKELSTQMRGCGFVYPVRMGTSLFNLRPDPYRLSIVAYSGLNFIGNAVERGYRITTEIGAGNISFSRISDTNS